MTFRDVINRVLRTVSEDQIDPAASELTDSYHLLIATFVNQIKEEIEDAHNWRALWTTLTVPVLANEPGASITNANERSRLVRVQDSTLGQFVPLVFDITDPANPFRMFELDNSTLIWKSSENIQNVPQPGNFAISTDATGLPFLSIYPPPSTARTYQLTMVVPQDELGDEDLDVNIRVPARPLIINSVYYALAERGEELGVDNIYTEERARKALDDAISRDVEEQGGIDLVAT